MPSTVPRRMAGGRSADATVPTSDRKTATLRRGHVAGCGRYAPDPEKGLSGRAERTQQRRPTQDVEHRTTTHIGVLGRIGLESPRRIPPGPRSPLAGDNGWPNCLLPRLRELQKRTGPRGRSRRWRLALRGNPYRRPTVQFPDHRRVWLLLRPRPRQDRGSDQGAPSRRSPTIGSLPNPGTGSGVSPRRVLDPRSRTRRSA